MPEENGPGQQTDATPMDDFSRTMGLNLGESTPEAPATPEADSTPTFDWNTVNLETVDLNTVPEDMRPVAEAGQRRVREMRSGVDKSLGQVRDYEAELKTMREEINALRNPPAPAYEPGKVDMVAEKLGYDLASATPQARDSFNVVNTIIEGHPIIEGLKAEIATLKEQAGASHAFVQKQQDTAYEAEYAEAVASHGKDIVDRVIDAYGDMRGRKGLDGNTITVGSLTAQMTGKTAQEAADIDAKAKKAKGDAMSAAAAVATVPGAEQDMSNDEIDKQIHQILS